eukprot:Plantae.Rhodophyta-Purpureofilum_apyrenoidigerum.ctg9014.p1 GENE.Plantae.Rhodophyta-Purpureofilum_apyrenoidigerum.ctg9014~~Plantae.Rhodophyta-Purpureofilum_apyrenoidigerum.ctg9014.p1  ORF type:complete len:344 (+),score=66.49 Plantae.Rhodophyta-Purpureofilum_apyrenoidigerum.ctg9014:198-1229(+)
MTGKSEDIEAVEKNGQNAAVAPESRLSPPTAGVDSKILFSIILNFVSSTGIVTANKIVMDESRLGFNYATTVTFIHFVFTTMCLLMCAKLGVFTPKQLDFKKAAKLSFVNMGFVVCSNLSLQYNSVGFYQVMKHMTVAAVVAIEALVYKKFLDRALWAPLGLVILGVTLTGATDFKLNLTGTMFATANILCTSFYQIWCGTLQKSLDADPLQLQLYTAPISALFVMPFMPILDNYSFTSEKSILRFPMTSKIAMWILLTAVLAFAVNISIFMVIGKTSAVTYNVLGHFKTCTLLAMDYLAFGRKFEIKNFSGLVITLTGVVSYSQVKMRKANQQQGQSQAERK